MRIFVYEWTCCQPEAPLSWRREGWAMLRALLEDLGKIPGVQPLTLLHESTPGEPACETHRASERRPLKRFRQLAEEADVILVIAPETDGQLLQLARAAEEIGTGRWLGSTIGAIALTGAKDVLAAWWQKQGVPTPPGKRWDGDANNVRYPAVLKPRDGAGSLATFLVHGPDELAAALTVAHAEQPGKEWFVQDFAAGQAASVAFLMGPAGNFPLLPASQRLSCDGRFHYEGGALPLAPALAHRAVELGRRALAAVPGLGGYVGVDLVLGDASDRSQDFAIEINPRLTTSYIGLRLLAETNVAAAMLDVLVGGTPKLSWRPAAAVVFGSDGSSQVFTTDLA